MFVKLFKIPAKTNKIQTFASKSKPQKSLKSTFQRTNQQSFLGKQQKNAFFPFWFSSCRNRRFAEDQLSFPQLVQAFEHFGGFDDGVFHLKQHRQSASRAAFFFQKYKLPNAAFNSNDFLSFKLFIWTEVKCHHRLMIQDLPMGGLLVVLPFGPISVKYDAFAGI